MNRVIDVHFPPWNNSNHIEILEIKGLPRYFLSNFYRRPNKESNLAFDWNFISWNVSQQQILNLCLGTRLIYSSGVISYIFIFTCTPFLYHHWILIQFYILFRSAWFYFFGQEQRFWPKIHFENTKRRF